MEAYGITLLAQWYAASKWLSWDLNLGLLVLGPLPSRENHQAEVGAWEGFTHTTSHVYGTSPGARYPARRVRKASPVILKAPLFPSGNTAAPARGWGRSSHCAEGSADAQCRVPLKTGELWLFQPDMPTPCGAHT